MNGWQIAVIVFLALSVGTNIASHGTYTRHNAICGFVGIGILLWFLIKGGFWS